MAHHVHVHQRLRPLRLAFLVAPDDAEAFARTIQINTCIWGGVYNAIIPLLADTPDWWDTGAQRPALTPREIFDGYRTAFEPDIFVVTDGATSAGLGLEERSVVALEDIISDEDGVVYGVSVIDAYRHLWQREFRFVRKDEPEMILPVAPATPLVAAACGAFPTVPKYFEQGYRDGFKPRDISPTPAELVSIQVDRSVGTPLRVGCVGLGGHRAHPPCLFLLDPSKTIDLVDFWNLRALGWRVVAVPIEDADDGGAACAAFIRDCNLPLVGNPELRQWTRVVKSRSISVERFMEYAQANDLAANDAASVQPWVPRVWDARVREGDEVVRPDLDGGSARTERAVDGDDGAIAFEPIEPRFDIALAAGKPRWAEVIDVRAYSNDGSVATVFPTDLPNVRSLLRGLERSWQVSTTTEGIVVQRHSTVGAYRWHLPSGSSLAAHWLKGRGRDVERSSAGRTADELLRKLGGPIAAGVLADRELVRRLNALAKPLSPRCLRYQAARSLLLRISDNDSGRAERTLRRLVTEFEALRVGAVLQCPHCRRHNWFALDDLSDAVGCAMCLRTFPFPATRPDSDVNWAYRPQGPFAVPNYAEGAYAVALALRFLAVSVDAEASWATGIQVAGTVDEGGPRELDLVVWCRERWRHPGQPTLILGECKSFSAKFDGPRFAEAVRRVVTQADRVVLLFATLDDDLDDDARANVSSAVEIVRRSTVQRARVLILTGRELFARESFPHCWDRAGEPFERWTTRHGLQSDLEWACAATEAVYAVSQEPGRPTT